MAAIKFNCSHCRQSLEAPEDLSGQPIECPSCHKTISIPESVKPPPVPSVTTRPTVARVAPPTTRLASTPPRPSNAQTPAFPVPLNAKTLSIVVGIAILIAAGIGIRYWYNNVYWTTMRGDEYHSLCVTCQVAGDRFIWTDMAKTRYHNGTLELYAESGDSAPGAVYRGVNSYAVRRFNENELDPTVGVCLYALPHRQQVNVAEYVQQRREQAEKQQNKQGLLW